MFKIPSNKINERLDYVTQKLSLTDVRKRIIGNLSKGYRQRVGLAQALIHNPEVLILDEPTEGLDPNQIAQIRELIKSLANKHTILLSSHILSEVQNTCDQVIIIDKGKIIQKGSYDELSSLVSGSKKASYQLIVDNNVDILIDRLKQMNDKISNVRLVENAKRSVEFELNDPRDSLDPVIKVVLDEKCGMRELTKSSSRGLEELFMQLTNN